MVIQELINILMTVITILGLLAGMGFGIYHFSKNLKRESKKFRFTFAHVTVLASISLYIISLTQEAITYYNFDNKEETLSGLILLLMGSTAILGGALPEWIIWIANPVYIYAIILLLYHKKKSQLIILISIVFALLFLSWQHILISTSGTPYVISEKKTGYTLWLLSFIVLWIGAVIHFSKTSKSLGSDTSEHLHPSGKKSSLH